MSRASDRAGIGAALLSGLATRGGGAQLPAQVAAEQAVVLTPAERLADLERRIVASVGQYQQGLRYLQTKHKVELGELLAEINDDELYMEKGYEKFGHYVKGEWGWDRSYGYRMIDLALVRRALAPLGPAVTEGVVEAHARELAPVVRYDGDATAREFVQLLRVESGEKKVTAAVIRIRREKAGLGVRSSDPSPIGDEDENEVVDAELVDDDEAAELVNREIRSAAEAAEKALRQLDEVLAAGVAPFHRLQAAQDLSRVRSAGVRLQRHAERLPGLAHA